MSDTSVIITSRIKQLQKKADKFPRLNLSVKFMKSKYFFDAILLDLKNSKNPFNIKSHTPNSGIRNQKPNFYKQILAILKQI